MTDRLAEIEQQWLDVPTSKISSYAWAAQADIEWLIEALERLRTANEEARQAGLRRGAELAVETLEGQRDRFEPGTDEYHYLNEIIDGLRVGLAMALAYIDQEPL